MDDTFKRELVRAVFLVATAAGNLETPQAMQLTRLPALLQMPEDQYRQIIEEAI